MHASLAVLTLGVALFTLIEVIVVIVILGFLAIMVGVAIDRARQSMAINGRFVSPPATVPAGGSAPFTFQVTKTVAGNTTPVFGREVSFTVSPTPQLSVSPAQQATDASGQIVVTVTASADYTGQGTITDTDVTSGSAGTPVTFTVQ